MVDRRELFGSGLRMLLQGGSVAHLLKWVKDDPKRDMQVSFSYPGVASWGLKLTEDGRTIADVVSHSFEGCTLQAVTALGKL